MELNNEDDMGQLKYFITYYNKYKTLAEGANYDCDR
jgi:hypothetical protein